MVLQSKRALTAQSPSNESSDEFLLCENNPSLLSTRALTTAPPTHPPTPQQKPHGESGDEHLIIQKQSLFTVNASPDPPPLITIR